MSRAENTSCVLTKDFYPSKVEEIRVWYPKQLNLRQEDVDKERNRIGATCECHVEPIRVRMNDPGRVRGIHPVFL